jgi:DNA-directed RNA polymerase subunit RPC12/RpoP
MSCIARVWDNGDMTDCGKKTQHEANLYCNNCRSRLLMHHRDKIARLTEDLAAHESTVKELLREAERR